MILIRDRIVSKGTLILSNKNFAGTTTEYTYYLYEFGLILQNQQDNAQIRFNFYDSSAECERDGTGKIILKNKNQEYEVYCVGNEETNHLGINIVNYLDKAHRFSEEVVIKKYVKNKSIFIAISKKNLFQVSKVYSIQFNIVKLKNIGISFIQKGKEFMYFWIHDLMLVSYKTDDTFKAILVKIHDYQIDHYIEDSHYPIILSPMKDNEGDEEEEANMLIELDSLLMLDNFTKVDKIYINFRPFDVRLEFKLVEKLMNFCYSLADIMNSDFNRTNNENFLHNIENILEYNFLDSKNVSSQNEQFLLIKQIFIEEIKMCFSIKFDNIDIFFDKANLVFMKPIIEDLGLKILNIDSSIFNLTPYARTNLFYSREEFFSKLGGIYSNQLISELVKSFGGFSSFTSFQFVENINRNILNNMRNRNIVKTAEMKKKKNSKIKELYQSSFLTVSIFVSGLFMKFFMFFSLFGKYFSQLTLDSAYQQKRLYKINKRIKSLSHGIRLAFKMFFFNLLYVVSQCYYVPIKFYNNYEYYGLILAFFVILIGFFLKPLLAFIDFFSRNLETISISINDVLGDRVRRIARFQRYIAHNALKDYNYIDAISYAINNQTNKKSNVSIYDQTFLVTTGILNKKKKVLLFITLEMLVVVNYVNYQFNSKYRIHFSECKLLRDIHDLPSFYTKSYNKKIGFYQEGETQIILVTYEKKYADCCEKKKVNFIIEVQKMEPMLNANFMKLIEKIFTNKKLSLINN